MALTEPSAAAAVDAAGPAGHSDSFDVLVLDAASRQALAAARSLGRAGLRVATAESFAECDPTLPVLAFHSRYSIRSVVLPSFATQAEAFADAVVAFARHHPTRVVLPATDGSIAALAARRADLEALGCHLALPPTDALEVANDKERTLWVARRLGIRHPPTRRLYDSAAVPEVLRAIGLPAVLKPTHSWAMPSGQRLQPVEVVDEAEGVHAARRFLGAGAGVLAQRWVSGRREGVTLFIQHGEVRASFAHVEHRTVPALGGASVLRESMPMPADVYAASVRLASAIGLEGLCEVEFRRDTDGTPLLMEINARLVGSIETALHAGLDFPLMAWRSAVGLPVGCADGYRAVRTRWLRGDLRWLRDNFTRVGRPDAVSRRRALWAFGSEFLRSVRYDCVDWRDLGPVGAEVQTTARSLRVASGVRWPTGPARKKEGDRDGL